MRDQVSGFWWARPTRDRQAGLTLVETLIAVVIGIIIIAGAFVVFGQVTSGTKLSGAEQDLVTAQLNIRQLYQGQPNYTGLSISTALAAKVFPNDMVNGTQVNDAWDGPVTIAAASNPTQFTIQFTQVPQDICVKFASFEAGQWEAFTINGTGIDQTGGSNPVTEASGACTTGNTNTLLWTSA